MLICLWIFSGMFGMWLGYRFFLEEKEMTVSMLASIIVAGSIVGPFVFVSLTTTYIFYSLVEQNTWLYKFFNKKLW